MAGGAGIDCCARRLVLQFSIQCGVGQVIWAIGWSMVCLALLLSLPDWLITALGAVIILGHNAFDAVPSSRFGSAGWLWTILHAGGPVTFGKFFIYIAYPFLPWLGVMAVGYGFGRMLQRSPRVSNGMICTLGISLIGLFAILRGGNLYGDPDPWTAQPTFVMTVLSILNCDKYPPSLAFLLMTLGPTFVLWPLLDRWKGPIARFLIVFGRVPLFFYLTHLFVVHLLTMGIVYWQTSSLPDWLWGFPPGHAGPGCGVSLPVLYLIWLGVVFFHYPLCVWYGRLKRQYPNSLLRFL